MIGLILAILTIGAVSASENMTDATSLNDIEEASQDNSLSGVEENSEDVLSDDEFDPVSVEIRDYVDVDSGYIADAFDNDYVNGSISLRFDDNADIVKHYSTSDRQWVASFSVDDLGFTPSYGKHNITFTYQKEGVDAPYTTFKEVEFTYKFVIDLGGENYYSTEYGCEDVIVFYLPEDASGVMDIKINGKSYKIHASDSTIFALDKLHLNVGVYKLEATFNDDANRYPQRTVTKDINITPHVAFPSFISVGEKDLIEITAHKGSKLSAILYELDDDDKKTKIGSYSGNTKISIPLEKLATLGFHSFSLDITCGNLKYPDISVPIFVEKNYGKIKVDVTKVKDSAKVVVTSPKLDSLMDVTINNQHVYNINLNSGNAKKVFSSLPVGKHKIKFFTKGTKFYSKTFFITVKKADKVSLSLKKVKVKKSAKKLVLKATVKYDKKPVVKKKITFKFKGKKYTARTNKYGVAKLTIGKNVLKKLKVGKKVVYKAAYSGVVVKKTVRVKR